MLTFSPYNPVVFGYGNSSSPVGGYNHVFSVSDHIMVECFRNEGEDMPALSLVDADSLSVVSRLAWNEWRLNDIILSFYELRGLSRGRYRLKVGDDIISNEMIVTDDRRILDGTSLVQFCQRDNKDRLDVVTWINGTMYYIDFRIPGGFLDEDWSFGVDCDQIVGPDGDIVDINAVEYTEKKLTVGFPEGVPLWVGEMVNRIMSCDLVYIDGQRYTRAGSSVVEKSSEAGEDRFVYTQMLRQAQHFRPEIERRNQLALRRTPRQIRRTVRGLRKI